MKNKKKNDVNGQKLKTKRKRFLKFAIGLENLSIASNEKEVTKKLAKELGLPNECIISTVFHPLLGTHVSVQVGPLHRKQAPKVLLRASDETVSTFARLLSKSRQSEISISIDEKKPATVESLSSIRDKYSPPETTQTRQFVFMTAAPLVNVFENTNDFISKLPITVYNHSFVHVFELALALAYRKFSEDGRPTARKTETVRDSGLSVKALDQLQTRRRSRITTDEMLKRSFKEEIMAINDQNPLQKLILAKTRYTHTIGKTNTLK